MLLDIRTPFMLAATLVATADAASLSRDAAANRVVGYHATARAPETGLGLELPAGAELVLGSYIKTTFSCEDEEHQRYGYYADVDNNCQVFHICNPIQLPSSHPQRLQNPDVNVLQYSFYCGNGTVFDQFSMTCAFEDDAIPCGNSPDFYYLNDNLGIEDALLLTDDDVAKKVAFVDAARGQQQDQTEISPPGPSMEEMETSATDEPVGSTRPPFRAQTPPFGKRQPPPKSKPHGQQKSPQQKTKTPQSKRPGQQPKYTATTLPYPSDTTSENTSIMP